MSVPECLLMCLGSKCSYVQGPWICIPQLLNDTDAGWEIGFITPANDRTISPWLILIPTPSFLFSLKPNIFLCFCLLLHFLNVILFQNINIWILQKSNIYFYRFSPSVAFFCFPFPLYFLTDSMIYSEWERTVVDDLPLLINDCAKMMWKTKGYEKTHAIPLFTGLFLAN